MLEELKRSARTFKRTWQSTTAIFLMIALAAAAASAAISVMTAVLVNPLHVSGADRLVVLRGALPSLSGQLQRAESFLDYQPLLRGVSAAAGYSEHDGGVTLAYRGRVARSNGAEVTPAFFSTLGLGLQRGRGFAPEELQSGRNRVIVIGDDLSKGGLFAGEAAVGESVTVNGVPFTVIGVAPPGFRFPRRAEFWIPISLGSERIFTGQAVGYGVIARLAPGVPLARAQGDLKLFAQDASLRAPNSWPSRREIQMAPLADEIVGQARSSLRIVVLALALVWLAAAANIAAMVLARAAARETEMAVRWALGASPGRLVRHVVADAILVSVVAFLCGVLAALMMGRVLVGVLPAEYSGATTSALTPALAGFVGLLAVVTGSVSVLPALLRIGRSRAFDLGTLAGTRTASARRTWRRTIFTVSQMAVAVVLVGGGVVLAMSVVRLSRANLGFDPADAVSLGISIPATGNQRTDAYQQVLERLRAMPAVRASGATTALPLTNTDVIGLLFSIEGRKSPGAFKDRFALTTAITPGYLEAMGIPILAGRAFTAQDGASAPPVAIVNRALARRYGSDVNELLGRRLALPGGKPSAEIIGVVEDVRHMGPGADAGQQIFLPQPQMPARLTALVLRTRGRPLDIVDDVRAIVAGVDRSLAVYNVTALDELVRNASGPQRRLAVVIGMFALVALVLAGVGAHAAMAQFVTERRHEIGVRIALGARPSDVARLVFGQAAQLAACGIACGIGLSVILLKIASGSLFGVQTFTLGGYAAASAMLIGLSALACAPSAISAIRVDPVVTLRNE
jgi:putative ABC transport system permease protein